MTYTQVHAHGYAHAGTHTYNYGLQEEFQLFRTPAVHFTLMYLHTRHNKMKNLEGFNKGFCSTGKLDTNGIYTKHWQSILCFDVFPLNLFFVRLNPSTLKRERWWDHWKVERSYFLAIKWGITWVGWLNSFDTTAYWNMPLKADVLTTKASKYSAQNTDLLWLVLSSTHWSELGLSQ